MNMLPMRTRALVLVALLSGCGSKSDPPPPAKDPNAVDVGGRYTSQCTDCSIERPMLVGTREGVRLNRGPAGFATLVNNEPSFVDVTSSVSASCCNGPCTPIDVEGSCPSGQIKVVDLGLQVEARKAGVSRIEVMRNGELVLRFHLWAKVAKRIDLVDALDKKKKHDKLTVKVGESLRVYVEPYDDEGRLLQASTGITLSVAATTASLGAADGKARVASLEKLGTAPLVVYGEAAGTTELKMLASEFQRIVPLEVTP